MARETWQEAWVEVLPDFRGFKPAADREITSVLGAAGAAGGVAAGDGFRGGILAGIPKLAGPLLGALAALGIGNLVGRAIGSGINYGIDAIGLASDLAESVNAVEVTFGEQIAADIRDLAESAPKDLRITQKAFNEYATRFSAFGKQIVGPSGDVVGWLDELTTRGADFASVYNLEVADALALFQSGLAGESEPLRKYGLDLSAATIEAYAYANGIGEAGRELTEAEKIQARYGAILEQTAAVQGDAAATSGELAGQQREFAVALEEAQTEFGEALLPIATDLLNLANEEVIPALKDFLTEYGPELADSIRDAMPELKDFVTELADAAPVMADFAKSTLPLLVQGMRDVVEILTGFPGWNEFLGIPELDDQQLWDKYGGGGSMPAPLVDDLDPSVPGGSGGGGGMQFAQYNTFQPGMSEGNVADLAAARFNQLIRENA